QLEALYKKHRVYGRRPRLVVEEFVDGKTCSIAAFSDVSGQVHFCEGIVTLVNARDIGVNDNYIYSRSLPGDFSEDLGQRLFETAAKGVQALGMASTPAHVELVY